MEKHNDVRPVELIGHVLSKSRQAPIFVGQAKGGASVKRAVAFFPSGIFGRPRHSALIAICQSQGQRIFPAARADGCLGAYRDLEFWRPLKLFASVVYASKGEAIISGIKIGAA